MSTPAGIARTTSGLLIALRQLAVRRRRSRRGSVGKPQWQAIDPARLVGAP
jgi:hypothetical protein